MALAEDLDIDSFRASKQPSTHPLSQQSFTVYSSDHSDSSYQSDSSDHSDASVASNSSNSSYASHSSQSSYSSQSSQSSQSSNSIKQKIITRDDRRFDITFLNNKLKTRKTPGVYETPKHTQIKRCTPSKSVKLKIIKTFHSYQQKKGSRATLKRFKRKYRSTYSGSKSWISKLSDST